MDFLREPERCNFNCMGMRGPRVTGEVVDMYRNDTIMRCTELIPVSDQNVTAVGGKSCSILVINGISGAIQLR